MISGEPTVHIISHTHWDREWFLPARYTREWLLEFAEKLVGLLERDPKARFVLDGQTILIEDYLEVLGETGGDAQRAEERFRTLIRERRIAVGPYYQQPDWQIPGGEALVRNLLIGRDDSNRLGAPPMQVGWLLDNFGQVGQAVQIHASSGLQGIFFWRGADLPPHLVRTELRWVSPNGSMLPCVYLIDSYRNGMRLLAEPTLTEARVRAGVKRLSPFATQNHVLLMNGYDQETEPEEIATLLSRLRAEGFQAQQDLPGDYLREVFPSTSSQPVLNGRQFSGRYVSVFPGVLSARTYLKVTNSETERLLQRYVEPLGLYCDSRTTPYPHERLQTLWRMLLRNHPHDSICGVSVDAVHADMEQRYQAIRETACSLLAEMTTTRSRQSETTLVFNPHTRLIDANLLLPTEDAIKSVGSPFEALPEAAKQETPDGLLVHLRGLPALGVAQLDRHVRPPDVRVSVDEERGVMRSGDLEVAPHPDGTVDIADLQSGTVHRGLNVLRDGGDAGDTYSFSTPGLDSFVTPAATSKRVHFVSTGPLHATARIELELPLPTSLSPDRSRRSDTIVICPAVLSMTLEAGMPIVRFRLLLRNRARDHRLQVLFPLPSTVGEHLLVETQFNVEEQPVLPPNYEEAIPSELKRLMIGAREPKRATSFPQQRFVDIPFSTHTEDADGYESGMAVINSGLPEGETVRDDTGRAFYALTVLRSTGWLARGDVATRTGDAGPAIRTPGAQCLRDLEFRYAVYPHGGSWEDARVRAVADEFLVRPLGFKGRETEGSLLSVDSPLDSVACESLRLAADGGHVSVRLYNQSKSRETARLGFGIPVRRVSLAGLDEVPKREIAPEADGSYTIDLPAKQILTVVAARTPVPRGGGGGTVLRDRSIERGLINQASTEFFRDILPRPNAGAFDEYLERFPIPEEVTEAMIREEELRERSIQKEYRTALRSFGARFGQDSEGTSARDQLDRERLLLRSKVSTLRRTALEAELSLLYLREYRRRGPRVFSADDSPNVAAELRRIGRELNRARIAKRLDDYLVEYFAASPNTE